MPSRVRPYAELLRLPNVFTALADVLLGYLFTHQNLEPFGLSATLIMASALLYLSGMVLNDVFDRESDARERPDRPIVRGAIPLARARRIGITLLVGGVALGWGASAYSGLLRPGLVATLLAALVLAYDGWLKRTPLGALAMGGCRMLNVLLGMSVAGSWQPVHWLLALGIGVYVAGVTLFARTEARRSTRGTLVMGMLTMAAGIGLLAWFPSAKTGLEFPTIELPVRWYFFWAVIGLLVLWRSMRAIMDPRPPVVQAAVKSAILSLIVLDAGCLLAVHRPEWAVAILVLLVPATLLGRWIYST